MPLTINKKDEKSKIRFFVLFCFRIFSTFINQVFSVYPFGVSDFDISLWSTSYFSATYSLKVLVNPFLLVRFR